jgi:predicted DNA-binding transcriptional regulator YafY
LQIPLMGSHKAVIAQFYKTTMPANKNAMTRYKILDELLSSKYHDYSLDDLTEEVSSRLCEIYPASNGVVRRTIEKDIHYLEHEGPFGVEIERYTAAGYDKEKQRSFAKQCLRYSDPSFSIFKKEMSDDEKYLLGEALSLLGQFEGLPNLEGLEGLRLGLNVERTDRKIISLSKNPLETSNILGELFTAISQKQVIELHYHKFQDPNKTLSLNVHPYLLKEYNRRWYLFAAAESDEKFLCFALDRIDSVVPQPSHHYLEYDGDINERFEDIIGVTLNDGPVLQIVFWVSDKSKDYVETKPLHESQKHIKAEIENKLRGEHPILAGGRFFQIDCIENYELIRELSSFGKELIVLQPCAIKDKVARRAAEMNEIYKKV